jgi:hypothetical protein
MTWTRTLAVRGVRLSAYSIHVVSFALGSYILPQTREKPEVASSARRRGLAYPVFIARGRLLHH